MIEGGNLDCKVLSVMMRHLNISNVFMESNLFGPELLLKFS